MGSGSKLPCKKAARRDGGHPYELRVLSLLYLLYILDLFVLLSTFTACASLLPCLCAARGINAKDGRRLFEHRICRAGPR